MEKSEMKRKFCNENGEVIYNYREYNINNENNNYILRLETNNRYLYFIISSNDNIEYNYKANMNLSTIVNKLELNSIKYNNLDLILDIFDEVYKNNKLSVDILNDESCVLIINLFNVLTAKKYEIKLVKNCMKEKDKFDMLFNQFKLLKKNNYDNDKIEEMNNKINELNNKIDKKDEEIKDIINKKDLVINEINQKVISLENKMQELENKNIDIVNKYENEIKLLNNKIMNLENNINNSIIKINDSINCFNLLKEEKNIDNNNVNKMNNNIFNDEINKNEIIINNEYQEKEINLEKINNNKEYEKKINYEFVKDPKNLKYKSDLISSNSDSGYNDIFEIYISYKDNQEYIVSPNYKNFNLNIFNLRNNQKILSLQKHENSIRTIRYFINNKNKNEYLISADSNQKVIIWDITNNYNIKYIIDTKYASDIYSCLLVFPENMNDNFIVTSTYCMSKNNEEAATKVYSFNDCKFIKYINNTSDIHIYYLLSWYNKNNNQYYIIQFSKNKILINNLISDELYSELINIPEGYHYSGVLYYKDNKDYLCSSSTNGYLNIWDLYEKKIYKNINTNGSNLAHVINWNNKYIIAVDINKKSFKIIEIENNSIYDIKNDNKHKLYCIKKVNHPIYGESLLSVTNDKVIKLWTIE
jgi:hypothetical protein